MWPQINLINSFDFGHLGTMWDYQVLITHAHILETDVVSLVSNQTVIPDDGFYMVNVILSETRSLFLVC